ncbi:MAG: hypothetical protein KIT80_04950 [Chitinophagaceae bacterium]|nr:hypothetical protein [Chitinophagaceae bacterium]MCW5926241.1 hypothetical protein [Chitinophagaceae bacterium]
MTPKRLTVLVFVLFFHQLVSAQSFMHSVGATISILDGKSTDGNNNTISLFQTNLSYFPRYNFVEYDNASVSVGLPLGIGVGIANNMYSDYGVAFAYDVPAVLDYNFGYKSTPDNDSRVGGYLGAGFGYYGITVSKSTYSDFTARSYGPMIRAGFRFSTPRDRENGHGITVGFFYKKGLESEKFNTYGCNVYFDF